MKFHGLRCVGVAPLLLSVLVPSTSLALSATEVVGPQARGFESLTDLRAVRGGGIMDKFVDVTADAAESWVATVEGPFLSVSPAGAQMGNARLRVSFNWQSLTGNGPFDGAVVISPPMGTAIRIPVSVRLWPRAVLDMTPDELADPLTWPLEGGYGGEWNLWGFIPNDISHPGDNVGRMVRTEEKTPCTGGNTTNCTRPGQAGLTAGMSVDRAWLLSTGDPRVVVAVLDSGIKWRELSLVEKAYLNAAELRACPPPGATADMPATFDVNGDGIFNIRDYEFADPPYAEFNNNGRLDAQDLIRGTNPSTNMACSDGVDDDNNGYTDDISGWDFLWNDNDPSDDTDYGHGTGEANDSVGQVNDDTGAIGMCARCLMLQVRVGDSFIADNNQFAEAVVFSVDSGASVVQEALGTLNTTPFGQLAIDYAWNNNVLVVASAADETSVHHNMPANGEHLINVHAITFDTDGQSRRWRDATTFLNFNNCTNYGAHLQLSASGTACSSEAVGKTAGHTGLIYSYYKQLQDETDTYFDTPLTAGEVFQVLIQSADDIDVTGAEKDPEALAQQKYPSNEGWDEAFGYGRNNVRRSLELIRDKKIPPEVDFVTPKWFETFDPSITPMVNVEGTVKVSRDDSAAWTLEVAKGIAPAESDFTTVSSGSATRAAPFAGSFGSIDISNMFADPETPDANRDARTVTVRVRATVTRGTESLRGEYRKVFQVLRDPQKRQGLSRYLGAGAEGSPRMSDLDGDGKDELVMSLSDGTVHAFRATGDELPGWPVQLNAYPSLSDAFCGSTDPALKRKCHRSSRAYTTGAIDPETIFSSSMAAPSIGDLDGDGGPEKDVAVATMDGQLFVFSASGQVLPGFPVGMDPAHVEEFLIGKVQPSEHRFAELGFFNAPVLIDLDQDGDLELVISGMDQWVYAWHHDGSVVNGWPVHVHHPVIMQGPGGRSDERIIAAPTVAYFDGDQKPYLVVGTEELLANNNSGLLYALNPEGNAATGGAFVPGWPIQIAGFTAEVLPYVGKGMPNSVAAGDFDGDGKDEIVAAAIGGVLTKFDATGNESGAVPGMGQGTDYYGANHNLFDAEGRAEPAVISLINNPTIADLNGDGKLDFINGTAGLSLLGSVDNGGLRIPFTHSVSAWDADNGYFLDGFPRLVEDYQFFANYTVADIDGDGSAESVSGNGVYFVHAFRADGTEPAGWPKNTMGWIVATPAVGDLDGDGKMEVAVASREGWLFVYDTGGSVKKRADGKNPIQWSGYHHDEQNTGNIRTPLPDYGTDGDTNPPPDNPAVCGCATSSSEGDAPAWAAGMMALMLVLLRRRK